MLSGQVIKRHGLRLSPVYGWILVVVVFVVAAAAVVVVVVVVVDVDVGW